MFSYDPAILSSVWTDLKEGKPKTPQQHLTLPRLERNNYVLRYAGCNRIDPAESLSTVLRRTDGM